MKINVEGFGEFDVGPNNHLGTGGEASVYGLNSNMAAKILKEPAKALSCGLLAKISALQSINHPCIAAPMAKIYGQAGQIIGYAMPLVPGKSTLFNVGNQAWRNANGFTKDDCLIVVEQVQSIIETAHRHKALIVDGNQMNYMVQFPGQGTGARVRTVAIDTDSWAIAGCGPTAISPSIQDPLISGVDFNVGSDYYAFAVVTFQAITGVHPFSGTTTKYAKNAQQQRMKDGFSVFEPDITLNKNVRPFDEIPPLLKEWYKSIFSNKTRVAPPSATDWKKINLVIVPVSIPTIKTTISSGKLQHILLCKLDGDIVQIGVGLLWTSSSLYNISSGAKPVLAKQNAAKSIVRNFDDLVEDTSRKVVYLKGRTYEVKPDGLYELAVYPLLANKRVGVKKVWPVNILSTQVFTDVVYVDNLGTPMFKLATSDGFITGPCKALETCTVLDAVGTDNNIRVLYQNKGSVYKTWLSHDKGAWVIIGSPELTDQTYINLATTPSGVWLEIIEDGLLRYGRDITKPIELKDPSISTDMTLFQGTDGVWYYNQEHEVYKLKLI